ncbi:MAG: LysR family transcriptional regulator [Cohaesibacteraceae bacterium]|nr:LysR family transcriptional regulator [Cohaesibacteraceae bacterium]MBL4876117.1 LysR family transcriptional regulator [Cohaesibacteraceae bacterium]
MSNISLHHLRSFEAVIKAGNFQAPAVRQKTNRGSVTTSTKALEQQIGVILFEPGTNKVVLTRAGQDLHRLAKTLLADSEALGTWARMQAKGEETKLTILLGNACSTSMALDLLQMFFLAHDRTRLDLQFANTDTPVDRLVAGDADILIHHFDQNATGLEFIPLGRVQYIPVVAPEFLGFPITTNISPGQMRSFSRIVINDTLPPENSRGEECDNNCVVRDLATQKQVILKNLGWGYLPDYLIAEELKSGRLIPITSRFLKIETHQIAAIRSQEAAHGPIASALWDYIGKQAEKLSSE